MWLFLQNKNTGCTLHEWSSAVKLSYGRKVLPGWKTWGGKTPTHGSAYFKEHEVAVVATNTHTLIHTRTSWLMRVLPRLANSVMHFRWNTSWRKVKRTNAPYLLVNFGSAQKSVNRWKRSARMQMTACLQASRLLSWELFSPMKLNTSVIASVRAARTQNRPAKQTYYRLRKLTNFPSTSKQY